MSAPTRQARARLLRQPKRGNTAGAHPRSSQRADQGGGVNAGKHLLPGRPRGIKVSASQPADEPAIRDRRGQALPVIAGEDLAPARSAATSHPSRCDGSSALTGADLARCESALPEKPARQPTRRPRRARRRTAARSAPRPRLNRPCRARRSATLARRSAKMSCTGSSKCRSKRAARCG